jgi:hypothetical protein
MPNKERIELVCEDVPAELLIHFVIGSGSF